MGSLILALAISTTGQVFPTATAAGRPAPRSTGDAAGNAATTPTGRDAAADPPARPTLKLKATAPATADTAQLLPPPDGGPSLPPTAPAVYRQADATGQIWTHTNPSWLAQWVAQRNSSLVVYPPPVTYAPRVMTSPCGPRGCPRR